MVRAGIRTGDAKIAIHKQEPLNNRGHKGDHRMEIVFFYFMMETVIFFSFNQETHKWMSTAQNNQPIKRASTFPRGSRSATDRLLPV